MVGGRVGVIGGANLTNILPSTQNCFECSEFLSPFQNTSKTIFCRSSSGGRGGVIDSEKALKNVLHEFEKHKKRSFGCLCIPDAGGWGGGRNLTDFDSVRCPETNTLRSGCGSDAKNPPKIIVCIGGGGGSDLKNGMCQLYTGTRNLLSKAHQN